jgi:hypothetical protein
VIRFVARDFEFSVFAAAHPGREFRTASITAAADWTRLVAPRVQPSENQAEGPRARRLIYGWVGGSLAAECYGHTWGRRWRWVLLGSGFGADAGRPPKPKHRGAALKH